jgi:hypothetical protein
MFHSQKEQLSIQQRVTNEQQLAQNESLKNMVDSGNEQLKEPRSNDTVRIRPFTGTLRTVLRP